MIRVFEVDVCKSDHYVVLMRSICGDVLWCEFL